MRNCWARTFNVIEVCESMCSADSERSMNLVPSTSTGSFHELSVLSSSFHGD